MANKLLTANRLLDGISVWLDSAGNWSTDMEQGVLLANDVDFERAAQIGINAVSANKVVEVNLIEVAEVDGRHVPFRLRERIRAYGPTVNLDSHQGAKW